ncbi:hypothetical protein ACHAXN_001516 [Cyclotella atomus]
MFVCGAPFLITLTCKIRFVTVQFVPRRTAGELSNGIRNVLNVYNRGGFRIQTCLMDGEFEKVSDKLAGIVDVNTCSKNEHVPEIERKIRHTKERCRCTKSNIKPKILPLIIINHLVITSVMFMNAYPDAQGISDKLSPPEIVLCWQLDFKTHCRAQLGAYCIIYDNPDTTTTNTMNERTRNGICLGPTGNSQGTFKFLDLNTLTVIKRKKFTKFPMPDSVIKKLERLGKRDKQSGALTFANRHKVPFDWDEEYEHRPLTADNAVKPKPATLPYPDIPAEMPGILYESKMPEATLLPDDPAPIEPDEEAAAAAEAAAVLNNANLGPREANLLRGAKIAGVNRDDQQQAQPFYQHITNNINVVPAENGEIAPRHHDDEPPPLARRGDEECADSSDVEEDENYESEEVSEDSSSSDDDDSDRVEIVPEEEALEDEPHGYRRSGRARRQPDWLGDWTMLSAASLLTANNGEDTIFMRDNETAYFGVLLMQMSLKQGLKVFGKKGEAGAMKEMQQLHDMETFSPWDPKSLTREERIRALSSLIFLKEKSNGEIKGRTCVNGAPQLQGVINVKEHRIVGKCNLPGAFLNVVTDEKVIMVLRRKLCELIVKVNPKLYRKYVMHTKKGVPVLYVELYKSLYGLMQSALLFYCKSKGELMDYGFKMNPYDPCFANKTT